MSYSTIGYLQIHSRGYSQIHIRGYVQILSRGYLQIHLRIHGRIFTDTGYRRKLLLSSALAKWLKSDLLARLSWQKGHFQYNSAPTQSVQLATECPSVTERNKSQV